MKIMLKNKKYQKILKNRVYVNDQSILTITITITTNKTLPTNKTLTRGKINNNIYLLHSNYDGLLGLICSVNIMFIKTKRGKRFVKTFLFCFTFFSFIFLKDNDMMSEAGLRIFIARFLRLYFILSKFLTKDVLECIVNPTYLIECCNCNLIKIISLIFNTTHEMGCCKYWYWLGWYNLWCVKSGSLTTHSSDSSSW